MILEAEVLEVARHYARRVHSAPWNALPAATRRECLETVRLVLEAKDELSGTSEGQYQRSLHSAVVRGHPTRY